MRIARQLVWTSVDELRRLPPAPRLVVVLLLSLCLALTAMAGGMLWRVLRAWRTSPPPAGTGRLEPAAAPRRSFSLLVPARHEQAGLGETLSRLAASDHSDVEVLVVVGDDDPATTAVAQRAARRHPGRIRVLLDTSQPKNRPTALNTALPACRGEVVGVLDAQDEVHPQLLRHVDACFTATGADVVHSGVRLLHDHASWAALRHAPAGSCWLPRRPHVPARQRRLTPLGGTTVFIRTDRLRQAGGWDPGCLAEDCELGVRLSSHGATVAVAYDPDLVTREETPGTVRELVRQRTRWNQGVLQVLRKGEWRRLPTWRQRLLARYTLAMPFLQAFTAVLIPLLLAAMLLRAPTLAAVLVVVPLVPMFLVLVAEVVGLAGSCRNDGVQPRRRDYARLALGMLPSHTLLAAAAVWAVARELRGHRGRTQTAHVGVHRAEPVAPPSAGRPVARQHDVVRHPPRPHRATTRPGGS